MAPILEADIAFSSMAQDKMGHALAYYRLLHELGEADPDSLAFGRDAAVYRSCSLVSLENGNWAQSIVRQVFFDESQAIRLTALRQCSYEPLAQVARKLSGELKYHTMHGRMWLARLGTATEGSIARVREAARTLYPDALGMFEAGPYEQALESAGVLPKEADLLNEWEATQRKLFSETDIPLPDTATHTDYSRYGRQPATLSRMLDAMQMVYRLEPAGQW